MLSRYNILIVAYYEFDSVRCVCVCLLSVSSPLVVVICRVSSAMYPVHVMYVCVKMYGSSTPYLFPFSSSEDLIGDSHRFIANCAGIVGFTLKLGMVP